MSFLRAGFEDGGPDLLEYIFPDLHPSSVPYHNNMKVMQVLAVTAAPGGCEVLTRVLNLKVEEALLNAPIGHLVVVRLAGDVMANDIPGR